MTARPLIGMITNNVTMNDDYEMVGSGIYEIEALSAVSDADVILLPTYGNAISVERALALCDGFYFPGGRANIHPKNYGEILTDAHGDMNEHRDNFSLPLIRQAVEQGVPVLAVCRGHQELAVAFGSSLYPEVSALEGRMNHRMPVEGTLDERVALRHNIELTKGGVLEKILGEGEHFVNTLHGQAVHKPGQDVQVEAMASDQTIEAISIRHAKNFALGVQWHPEFYPKEREVSAKIFSAFGAALRGH